MTLPALWDCQDCVAQERKHVGVMTQYNGRHTTLYECTMCGHLQRLPVPLEAYNERPSRRLLLQELQSETWVFQQWLISPYQDGNWRRTND